MALSPVLLRGIAEASGRRLKPSQTPRLGKNQARGGPPADAMSRVLEAFPSTSSAERVDLFRFTPLRAC